MKTISKPIENFNETIFAKMTALAIKHNAVNLSQGFPDFDGPDFIKEHACNYIKQGNNQYAHFKGTNTLRQTLSLNYKKYYDLDYTLDQITVTNGATQAIYLSLTALLNPGDEVILFEPYYDSYLATIQMARAIPKVVTLNSPEFTFKESELRNLITDKTKLIMLNTPHNPTGKVFSNNELEVIKQVCIENDLYVVSDEVYEYLTFDNSKHIPIATLEGMKERTLTISSSGKTFGLTGWKIGWICSSNKLSEAVRMLLQFNTFSINHPMQLAISKGLETLDNYIQDNKNIYENKRNFLFKELKNAGLNPFLPEGGYFIVCEIPLKFKMDDQSFCEYLITNHKIAAIPLSVFYLNSSEGKKHVRFCFAKSDETLRSAAQELSLLS
jgi:L-glutamine---4-(methylsulfanyl)-2-oxobutanoate aminotransferase